MLDEYKEYDLSFIEVILENLKRKVDIKLESDDFNYMKDKSYTTDYIKYIVPGGVDIEKLITILKLLNEKPYLLLQLPLDKTTLEYTSKGEGFNELVEKLDRYTASEMVDNKSFFIKKMINKENSSFPLLFKSDNSLKDFFTKKSEEIEHYFISNVLLFPINMSWFMYFDYDLGAIHFTYKNDVMDKIKNNRELKNLTFSDDEIDQLIVEANE
ncbi:hypothetical protein EI546_09620 [Aequorivita sp. H23M31]|uniref:Uncharacterized protein n=1 Tax=Aequorivita ciconiae TaxID=2494375 RepID=A0A410G3W5_9FLAO|nr:hypothetical protein [Aequorivita sp. H23M31]QAA81956.1 hypothetical protein EI546_09575 [Aequorivita sp. H23M31]QAA81964.1 hypothetical protein EI546_09620 [Aequorivita sp. H23M31]